MSNPSEETPVAPSRPPTLAPGPAEEGAEPTACALDDTLDEGAGGDGRRGRASRLRWSSGPTAGIRAMRMRVVVAADLRLDRRTGRLFSVDGATDPETHLRALGGRPLRPGYLFGPDGALHPCDRLRLPWFDVGFARDGEPLVVVNTPPHWSDHALADVLGVGTSGGPDYDRWLESEWTGDTPKRVVGAEEPFVVLSCYGGSLLAQSYEARVVGGRLDYRERRWPAVFRRRPGPWEEELAALLPEDLGSFGPLLVHPIAAAPVAARLRAAVPPAEARPATAWHPTPTYLDGPTDYRHRWLGALQRPLDPAAWAAIGAVQLPERVWLARDYGGRVERALRARAAITDGPLSEGTRAALARGLTLWTPGAALDPADDAPLRAARLAWTAANAAAAPLPLLTEWLAAEVGAGEDAPAAWDAIEARWRQLIALEAADRHPLPTLRRWEAPAALRAAASTREVARLVEELSLLADPLDFRLAWPTPWFNEVVTVAVAPSLGATLRAWFDGEAPLDAYAADELLALANALSAEVVDPERPFRVHDGPPDPVEACWRQGALRLRRADSAGRWTRDLDSFWPVWADRPPRATAHPALRVHLDGLQRAERGSAWVIHHKRTPKPRAVPDRYELWRLPLAPKATRHPYAAHLREIEGDEEVEGDDA